MCVPSLQITPLPSALQPARLETSELQSQGEVDRSRRTRSFQVIRMRARDLRRRSRRADIPARVSETRVIECIRKNSLELQSRTLPDMECFHQGQIDVLHRRPHQDVVPRIAESANVGRIRADWIAGWATRYRECTDIEPVIYGATALRSQADAWNDIRPTAEVVCV
jgi:hypothetical protein